MPSFDKRHVAPLIADSWSLALHSLFEQRARDALVQVGRDIRHQAFEARDEFPSIAFDDLLIRLGGGSHLA